MASTNPLSPFLWGAGGKAMTAEEIERERQIPVHVVSARAGHANPSVSLNIHAHLLPGQQEGAAAIVDAALNVALQE